MKVGDRVKVVCQMEAGPHQKYGSEGEVIEKIKYAGLPLVVRLDDGGLFHAGYPDVQKIA